MRFEAFDNNREKMNDQYAHIHADPASSEALYAEIGRIFRAEKSKQVGKGKAIRHYLENAAVFVNPADVFADMIDDARPPFLLRNEELEARSESHPAYQVLQEEGVLQAGVDFGHTMPDWRRVLTLGIPGLKRCAEERLQDPALSASQREFYLSVSEAYAGILAYIGRLAEKAREACSQNARFAAANLEALGHGAPRTLAEAMQLFFLFYTAQHRVEGDNVRSLGALDDLLDPYYEKGLSDGTLTVEEARELTRYFLYKWNTMHVTANMPFNLCTHVTPMTYLILEEYAQLGIPDPKIHIKCADGMPDKVYALIMDAIRKGNNSFVFINDKVARESLIRLGEEPQDAADYTLIGCYEPCAAGKELPCSVNGRILLPMAIESVMGRGKRFLSDRRIGTDFGDGFDSFEAFYAAVKAQLAMWTDAAVGEINAIEARYPGIVQAPVLSATYEDCMETGIDVYAGGAKYNNSSLCAFGIATAVDALAAIRKAVFEDKTVAYADLCEVLKNNWAGAESLRRFMRDSCPKYGNNDPTADALAVDLMTYMADRINGRPNGRGGVYRLGIFSIDWIVSYGKMLGASADGRLAGEPVSKNLCASVGMDRKGVTGVIHTVTKFDYRLAPNGAVLDLHLHPSAVSGDEGIRIMVSLLKVYLAKGGFAMQMNVVSAETLKKAQKEPEKYRNLQVRLCGWNVYFADLGKELQDDMIRSMEAVR